MKIKTSKSEYIELKKANLKINTAINKQCGSHKVCGQLGSLSPRRTLVSHHLRKALARIHNFHKSLPQ